MDELNFLRCWTIGALIGVPIAPGCLLVAAGIRFLIEKIKERVCGR